ncbi:MAG: hypothetical protein EZS28_008413 [Streblomastix strix]|uniref:Uncharacterized protein n=1 Tax=Streblomastix strix TaxID=222440 RepID=A0A5J4WN84_9EUKA|nr:MAG: hypothetical protein EZS28_008413 [Streblomastix strix]
MSAQRDLEVSPDAVTDKNGPDKGQQQMPRVFVREKKAKKFDWNLLQLLEAKKDDDGEIIAELQNFHFRKREADSLGEGFWNGERFRNGDISRTIIIRVDRGGDSVDYVYQGGCSEIALEYAVKPEQFRRRLYFWKFESVWQSEAIDAPILQTPVHTCSLAQTALQIVPGDVNLKVTAGIMSQSQQFDDKFKEYAKFNSMEEDAVARNIMLMKEGVCNTEMRKFDPKTIVDATGEEADFVLESLTKLGLSKTKSYMKKFIDEFKLAFLATVEAQNVREQLNGVYAKPDTMEIYSDTTKQRKIEIKKLNEGNFMPSHFSEFRSNQLKRGYHRLDKQQGGFPHQKGTGSGGPKSFRFGK